jgi:NADH:ubiquinone oxidoreductase subunit 6 (subunit J)
VSLSGGALRNGLSFILPEEGVSLGNIIVKMLCFNLIMKVQIMYHNNNNNNNNNVNDNSNNNTQLIFSQFLRHLLLPSVNCYAGKWHIS